VFDPDWSTKSAPPVELTEVVMTAMIVGAAVSSVMRSLQTVARSNVA
jgi:hypothetical protein